MEQSDACNKGRTILPILLVAIGGGLLVALAAQAVPRMVSRMMAGMMRTMMARMEEGGFSPAEM